MSDRPSEEVTPSPDDRHELRLDAAMAWAFGEAESRTYFEKKGADTLTDLNAIPWVHPTRDPHPADAARVDPTTRHQIEATGRYLVQAPLGRGGMGVVVAARDQKLGRDVAIKLLDQRLGAAGKRLRQFIEEGQIASQLQHPGIVPIYDIGTVEDGRPYFSMKRLEGRSFEEYLSEAPEGSRDQATELEILERAAEAVAFAHARQVIHRDLKPANLMVGEFGEVVVVDWGLAKVLNRPWDEEDDFDPESESPSTLRAVSEGLTSVAGSVMGTPAYMAPEQARGDVESTDARSDVYALGAILFRLLAGRLPVEGESAADIRDRVARGELIEAERLLDLMAEDSDPHLVRLAREALSPEKEDRPADAGEFLDRLESWRRAREGRAEEERVARIKAEAKAAEERRARKLAIGLAVAIIALGTLGAFVWRGAEKRREAKEFEVDTLFADARRLGEEAARERDPEGAERWAAATERAERALALARSASLPASEVEVIDGLLSDYREKLAARRQDIARRKLDNETLARLQNIREERAFRPVHVKFELDYQDVFRRYGIDPETTDSKTFRETVRNSALKETLIHALYAWAHTRRSVPKFEEGWKPMLDLAFRVDDNERRVAALRPVLLEEQDPLAAARSETASHFSDATFELLAFETLGGEGSPAAREVLRLGLQQHPSSLFLNLGYAFRCTYKTPFDFDRGVHHFEIASVLSPDNPRILTQLAQAHRFRGEHEQAEKYVARALALRPDFWLAWLERANLSLLRQDSAGTAEAFEKVEELVPDTAYAHFARAKFLASRKKHAEAAVAYRAAANARRNEGRNDQEMLTFVGISLERSGDTEGAEKAYREAIQRDPKAPRPVGRLGGLLFRTERKEEGVKLLQKAYGMDPREHRSNLIFGSENLRMRQYRKALPYLKVAAEVAPRDGPSRINYGLCLRAYKRFDEAIAELEKGKTLSTKGSKRWKDVENWLAETRRSEANEKRLQAVLAGKRVPENAQAWIELANFARSSFDYLAAARLWEDAFVREVPGLFERMPRARESAAMAAIAAVEGWSFLNADIETDAAGYWRQQAKNWLREELDVVEARHRDGLMSDESLEKKVRYWMDSKLIMPYVEADEDLRKRIMDLAERYDLSR